MLSSFAVRVRLQVEKISAHPTQRSIVIAVSPLVSLIVDQVSRLQKEGFFSAAVNFSVETTELSN